MEFETTLKSDHPTSETVVVYDKQDGRILHVHEFIGDGMGLYGPQGREERARISLEGARHHPNAPQRPQVLHHEHSFRWEHNTLYKVDLATAKIVLRRHIPDASIARGAGRKNARGTGRKKKR